ncbi:hypothetical protein K501DRAFT_293069 [Backusella circina FSU 941]|nr:hypothetical protein K501DRAFT_293069 [Backusella circina FSU 941]
MVRLSLTAAAAITTFFTLTLAESSESCAGDAIIWSQADLDAISSCQHYSGSITIDKTGSWDLSLKGVEYVKGNIIVTNNVDLQYLYMPDLKQVDGSITIEHNTGLSKLDVPQLQSAWGVSLVVLPSLDAIDFPAGLQYVNSLRVEDTKAPTITGLQSKSIHSLVFTNNNFMPVFDLSSVEEITGEMLVVGNRAMVLKAENLKTMHTSFFFHLAELQMPSLEHITGDISFHNNEMKKVNFEKLHTIDGTVVIANNELLSETSFPTLYYIGGALSIGNNFALQSIAGFPVLSTIGGVADFAGAFMEYQLPAIQEIRGGARLQTTSNKLQCAESEQKLKGEDIAKGLIWSCSSSVPQNLLEPTLNQSPDVAKPENLKPGMALPDIPKPEKKDGSPEPSSIAGGAGSSRPEFGNSMKDNIQLGNINNVVKFIEFIYF